MRAALNFEQLLSPSPGGVGRYTARLALHLAALGVEVLGAVARHPREEVERAWRIAGLSPSVALPEVMALPRPVLYDAWHLLGWPALAGAGAADVVHAPSLAVPPRHGKPLVVSVHDAAPWLFPEAFGRRGRWFHAMGARAAARRADVVLTGSQAAAEEVVGNLGLDAARVRVVPYGVDEFVVPGEAVVREVLGRFGLVGVPYVLWVGSLEPRKGVGTLVTAMARLPAGPGEGGRVAPHLVMAGYRGWHNEQLVPEAERAVLGERLHQLGRVAEAELQVLYANATAFAFPSLHEGFGLPVLEAMAAGVPVVASDIPPLREVAGGAALLVPPGRPDVWAEALASVLGDRTGTEVGSRVQAGRHRAAEHSWGATAQATLAVYRELA